MNGSALLLSGGLFCVWPLIIGFIGFQIGRRRLKFRSPIQIRLNPPDESDYDDSDEPTTYKPGVLARIKANAGSFKK
jgi:hypothetical protein